MGPIKPILFVIFIMSVSNLWSQSENQRIGTDYTLNNTLGAGISSATSVYIAFGTQTTISVDFGTYFNYFYKDSLFISAFAPFMVLLRFQQGVPAFYAYDFRDPGLTIGAVSKFGELRIRVGIAYSYPLGKWNPYQLKPGEVGGGSGYHKIGLSSSLSRIADPIVISTALKYRFGLPRRGNDTYSILPGEIDLSFSITEVINDNFAFQLSVAQALHLPTIVAMKWSSADTEYGLEISVSLFWTKGDGRVGVGLSKGLASIFESPVSIIDAYYEIKW